MTLSTYDKPADVMKGLLSHDPRNLLVMADIDGTKAEFHPDPAQVFLPENFLNTVDLLTSLTNNGYIINTGRQPEEAEKILGGRKLAGAYIHGLMLRSSYGEEFQRVSAPPVAEDLLDRLLAAHVPLPGMRIESKTSARAIHWAEAVHKDLAEIRAKQITDAVVADYNKKHPPQAFVKAEEGIDVLEIGSAAADKGTAVEAILQLPQYKGRVPVMLGDSKTDMPAFDAVRKYKGMTIGVGKEARKFEGLTWYLESPSDMRDTLTLWAQALTKKAAMQHSSSLHARL